MQTAGGWRHIDLSYMKYGISNDLYLVGFLVDFVYLFLCQKLKVPSAAYLQLHDFNFDDINMDDDDTLRVSNMQS